LPKYTTGFIYVLSNRAMPGIVKVGKTTRLAEDRAKELYRTSVALPFDVEFRAATSHLKATEERAHAILDPFRVTPKREFFRTSPSNAIEAVQEALLGAAGIAAWESEAGDLFVVISYPDLMDMLVGRPLMIDVWQAHSDGDLLELMGTDHPGHVAGFSDGDLGGDTDPVPYLDRDHTVPNGSINGRERLVSGERLLWFHPTLSGASCKIAHV
jgi:hypothetical protein